MTSISAARRALAARFRDAGLDSPELDARVLVGHALGLDLTGLVRSGVQELTPGQDETIGTYAARRLAREPVARILGTKEFWGLPLCLNGDTLVPRPETETVVEAALKTLDAGASRVWPRRIVDLGTGSGALLLALLTELPAAWGIGTDISPAALAMARYNAATLGLSERTGFVACDYGAALRGPFDLVISNPPYVAQRDLATLAPEVSDFDPHRALDGGVDGMDGYRAIAADASRLLASGGTLVVELGAGQNEAVARLFAEQGLVLACSHPDLAGIARALVVRAPP